MVYEIKYEPVIIGDAEKPKYNIYYTGGEYNGQKEFHSVDGVNGNIRSGYTVLNPKNWKQLQTDLFRSSLFARALTKPLEVNQTALSALIAVMQNESSETDLLMMLNSLGMTFTEVEKIVLNKCLSDNNFTIQL